MVVISQKSEIGECRYLQIVRLGDASGHEVGRASPSSDVGVSDVRFPREPYAPSSSCLLGMHRKFPPRWP